MATSTNVRTISARYPGKCLLCMGPIKIGERIDWNCVTRSTIHSAETLCPAPVEAPEAHLWPTITDKEWDEIDAAAWDHLDATTDPDAAYERFLEQGVEEDWRMDDLEMARIDAEAERLAEARGAWSSMR